jgi:Fe-S cluster biogenesis protein NfuA
MIPIHATATSDPQQLRWVVPRANLPPTGTVRQAPDRLGAWLDRGVIDELVIGEVDILITLGAEFSWREVGDEIREALGDALQDPAGWRVEPLTEVQLTEIVNDLLSGPIGALAQSHGGSIELVSVAGHNVTVRMSGTCHHCPASGSTLYDKLQRELRRRAGDQVTVIAENASPPSSFGKRLVSLLIR